ncbi:secretion protein HlyD, partial [Klebsiella pneumoniae]|nr:secretion protein HlyD [Klebsiella pneumoniae]
MREMICVWMRFNAKILTGCDNKPDNMLSGYSHGEFVYLSYSG